MCFKSAKTYTLRFKKEVVDGYILSNAKVTSITEWLEEGLSKGFNNIDGEDRCDMLDFNGINRTSRFGYSCKDWVFTLHRDGRGRYSSTAGVYINLDFGDCAERLLTENQRQDTRNRIARASP